MPDDNKVAAVTDRRTTLSMYSDQPADSSSLGRSTATGS
jgi:hypothetical protein